MKTLDILIGDDLFMDPIAETGIDQRLAQLKDVNITRAAYPAKVISEAQKGTYDIIVSDLDYGTTGRVGTEGYEIVEQIAAMQLPKRPYVIMCTSSDNQQDGIKQRMDAGVIDAYVSDGATDKFQSLVNHINENYKR